jgi:hypothetical protein
VGNFSRDTYAPGKQYVGVRLQQGVPLVDADWNELDDVRRNELYDSLNAALTDGVAAGSDSFRVNVTGLIGTAPGEVTVQPGAALVGGRVARTYAPVLYSSQVPKAGEAPFPPIPPLSASRTDVVYLDVWEREVTSAEDTALVNTAIGIETCVRICREVSVRVAVDTTTLPAAPAGHRFLPLARIVHGKISSSLFITRLGDIRPPVRVISQPGEMSFAPAFQPLMAVNTPATGNTTAAPLGSWKVGTKTVWIPTFNALLVDAKPFAQKLLSENAYGFLPLALPDGATLTALRVCGYTQGLVSFAVVRNTLTAADPFETVFSTSVEPEGGATDRTFNLTYTIPADPKTVVDNASFSYLLFVAAVNIQPTLYPPSPGKQFEAQVRGVALQYKF